jgi:hypothetical protein
LLYKGLLDPELFSLFSIDLAWERMKLLIERMRKERKAPEIYKWFEYLYDEMKKREQKLQQSKV